MINEDWTIEYERMIKDAKAAEKAGPVRLRRAKRVGPYKTPTHASDVVLGVLGLVFTVASMVVGVALLIGAAAILWHNETFKVYVYVLGPVIGLFFLFVPMMRAFFAAGGRIIWIFWWH